MTLVDDFCELFAGRKDAVGTEAGGALRVTAKGWHHWMSAHLLEAGPEHAIGVYPMLPTHDHRDPDTNWLVKWGCVDFDEGEDESLIHARNLNRLLAKFGIMGWIERSRSKGYHVWVFASDWVDAEYMRQALLAACQLVHAPTKEINPKQTTLAWDEGCQPGCDAKHQHYGAGWQLGNYVRLPYPGGYEHHRCVYRYDENGMAHRLTAERFATEALATRTPPDALHALRHRYTPPPPLTTNTRPVDAHRPAENRLSGLAYKKWREGPIGGAVDDRSAWLWGAARELAQSELTTNEQHGFLCDMHDWYCPKWERTPDRGRLQLERMVHKANGGH
jgi:hypothetical protein